MTPRGKSSSSGSGDAPLHILQQQIERPRASSSDAKLPSSESLVRCTSDTTSNKGISQRRQLQTITSGIALDDMKSPTKSLPPLSPSKGNHSPQCPYYGSPFVRRKSLDSDQQLRRSPPQVQQYHQHCAGHQLPPCVPNINSDEQELHRSLNSHSSYDNKQAFIQQLRAEGHRSNAECDSDSAVESLVFHYNPGVEVPPAEYALPASILKVYGVDCECDKDIMPTAPPLMPDRLMSSLTNDGSDNDDNYLSGTALPNSSLETLSTNRYELLPPDKMDPQVILPYHERKRLTEIKEKQEKKMARNKLKLLTKSKGAKTEKTPLNESSTKYNYDTNQAPAFKLFDQLTALIVGKRAEDPKQKQYGSIEDASKQYIDKGKDFIQRTQKERSKFREQCKSDELNNVTIPVSTLHGMGHSRAKMSSLSNALDSIADCSDDDEEDTYSSDEETGSSYYDSESYSNTTESTKKVWKHGDPSITSKKASKRDRIMERERLLQEEYEFKLRRLKKENELLAKKFRLFVLVAVAFILVAALSFALLLCIKMLLLA